jgi:hypothetical protein
MFLSALGANSQHCYADAEDAAEGHVRGNSGTHIFNRRDVRRITLSQ